MVNVANLPTTLRLTAKSHHGKNRLKEAGTNVWLIQQMESCVVCLNGKPGFLIQPEVADGEKLRRWVAIQNDKDFEYESLLN